MELQVRGRADTIPASMIVTRAESGLRLVTQPDHARVAAEILSLWRADDLPAHPRRGDLLFAVREHDNGWQGADAAPRVNRERGAPHDFLDYPEDPRRQLWQAASERFAAKRPAAAVLISRHALEIHRDRRGQESWAGFFETIEAGLAAQLEASGLDVELLESDYPWLYAADGISLRACGALDDGFDSHRAHVRRDGAQLILDPFPLAGATTFRVPCRYIPDRRYESDTDLAIELASARWTEFPVRLVPDGGRRLVI